MSTTRYEEATDELRQVTAAVIYNDPYSQKTIHSPTFVVKVQRKWLVQDGELLTDLSPPEPNLIAVYAPLTRSPARMRLKPVWRDLPTVTESEARHS